MPDSGLGSPYWYEWQIGLIECLKMLTDISIKSVVLQSSDFQTLDDVVVNYQDGSMTNIQVKHTDIAKSLTYSFLEQDSLLKNIAVEWSGKRKKYNIREVQLVTNKPFGPNRVNSRCSMCNFVCEVYPNLKQNKSYIGKDRYEENAIKWFKNEISQIGNDIFLCGRVFI